MKLAGSIEESGVFILESTSEYYLFDSMVAPFKYTITREGDPISHVAAAANPISLHAVFIS